MAKGNRSTPAPEAPASPAPVETPEAPVVVATAVEAPAGETTPPFAPTEVAPPPAPVEPPAPEAPAPAPAPEPRIEVGLESVAIIVAEPAPGVKRYIKGISDDGRVLAGDTRDESCYLNPHFAKSIIGRVRKAFPSAEIQLVLA